MSERIVLTGANLLDGDHAAEPDSTVVVEGERILKVVRGGTIPSGSGDRTLDLAGRTLMPGLWSCHFHAAMRDWSPLLAPSLGLEHTPPTLALIASQNLALALECGITSVVSASAPHYIDPAMRDAIQLGMIPGPRMLACSHELSTTGDVMDGGNRRWQYDLGNLGVVRLADGVDGFRHAVREEIARGADVVKVNASMGHGAGPAPEHISSASFDELSAAASAAHERGKMIRAHAASKRAILDTLRAGFDIIDHADLVDAECIDAILEAGASVVPSMLYSHRLLELYDAHDPGDPRNPMRGSALESPAEAAARADGMRREFDYTREMLSVMDEAGVRLALGDDYGISFLKHGEFASEFELYSKHLGIPNLTLIRWATKQGAELARRGDELGTIEEGKLADLLVLDGDPVADISCLGDPDRILAIIKGGAFVKDSLGDEVAGSPS
jgi:imidazolonepropionase-like amidohydrolase